jgi:hypothetical protein
MTALDCAHQDVGARLATHLRVTYQSHAAKRIAADFDVEEVTARGWLKGRMPVSRHLTRMVARWGKPFLDFLYAPVLGDPDLDIRLDRAIAEMTVLQAEFRRQRDAETARRVARVVPPVAAGAEQRAGGASRAAR